MANAREPVGLDQAIGQRIRIRRLELSMSQEVLAGRLGLTFQQLQKYEKGINRVAASRLFEIARHLEVPPSYLLTGQSEVESAEIAASAMSAPGVARLASEFAQIKSPKVRRLIIDLVAALAHAAEDEDVADVGPIARKTRESRRAAD